ncbi:hypothetical protein [Microbacterium lacticum]|uniref:ATP synthase protein I n=1 Tax=Microbacterium lacticum TaxID=33885 RepID=A0A4Y3ULF5_9MICO|nr:hypothetical protein [Microbacterium lacticum]TQM95097.1 hypothetical protein FHX68_2434 [Microbacterium lacticum]GEB95516.1 hypothetical protein MLA01_17350 [Microbacterium lacticum]GGI67167.1 hypothetical protein GCM10009724_17930 [Microbacterium lacticum]
MTQASAPNTPRTPREVSSNRLLRTTLLWSAIVTAGLAVVGAIVGFAVAGTSGLWSALVAVLLAAVFLGLTAGTILVANRWYGDPLYTPIFFGAVMGGWIVKFALFIVVLFVLRGAPWLNGTVFFVALVVSVIASLAIDVVVMLRMRVPHVGDVSLPTLADIIDEARRPSAPAPEGATPPEEGAGPIRSDQADENPPRG